LLHLPCTPIAQPMDSRGHGMGTTPALPTRSCTGEDRRIFWRQVLGCGPKHARPTAIGRSLTPDFNFARVGWPRNPMGPEPRNVVALLLLSGPHSTFLAWALSSWRVPLLIDGPRHYRPILRHAEPHIPRAREPSVQHRDRTGYICKSRHPLHELPILGAASAPLRRD